MAEKEYIERESFEESVRLRYCKDCTNSYNGAWCRACWVDDMLGEIEDAPTADAVEVRHGEWEDFADRFWARIGRMDLRCSICGKRASEFVGGTEDWWDNWKPNYCPHCGAKMDGKGDTE